MLSLEVGMMTLRSSLRREEPKLLLIFALLPSCVLAVRFTGEGEREMSLKENAEFEKKPYEQLLLFFQL